MPIPIIPIPPHLLLPNPATLAAVRAAATGAATSRASAAGASYLLASALAHNLWKQAPEWIREDESWRAFSGKNNKENDKNNNNGQDGTIMDDNDGLVDEMASLTAVIQKLEALVITGYDTLGSQRRMGRRRHTARRTVAKHLNDNESAAALVAGDGSQRVMVSKQSLEKDKDHNKDDQKKTSSNSSSSKVNHNNIMEDDADDSNVQISPLEWHAALLAYWQLCNQIRERYPLWRDRIYQQQQQHDNNIEEKIENDEQCSLHAGEDCEKAEDASSNPSDFDEKGANDYTQLQHQKSGNEEKLENDEQCNLQVEADYEDNLDYASVNQNETAKTNDKKDSDGNNNSNAKINRQHQSDKDIEASRATDDSESPMSNNTSNAITLSQIKELRTMLDYAVWAYEPEEELLRSMLLSGGTKEGETGANDNSNTAKKDGYQLIVHRTTSYMDPNETVIMNGINKKQSSSTKKNKRKPPGRVGYFVAISHTKRALLIGIKGTSTLEELLTDCCGRAVRVDLDNDPHGNNHSVVGENDAGNNDGEDVVESCNDVDLKADEIKNVPSDDDAGESDIDGSSAEIVGEDNATLHDETCNHDEDFLSSTSSVHQGDNFDDIVDVIHVSANDGVCPSESVEVELAHDFQRGLASSPSVESSCNGTTSCESKQGLMTSSKPKTSSSIRKIPSDNVLLLTSILMTKQQQSHTSSAQPTEILHSPTDEFMESHGIEMEENRSHKLRGAHEGILHCSQQLLSEISPLIEEYAVSKEYDVICTGHSLGAGTAILLAVLIRGRYSMLTEPSIHSDDTSSSSYDDEAQRVSNNAICRERVRAFAFAPPPVLDRASSLACHDYVTSIVYNSDIIPRSSLTNLDAFLTVLEAVRVRLMEVGMNPGSGSQRTNGSSKPKTNKIASAVFALFRKLLEGTDGDLLLDPSELQRVWDEAVAEASLGDGEKDRFYWDEEFGHHLFVPGKVLLMYESWESVLSNKLVSSEEVNEAGSLNCSKVDNGDGQGSKDKPQKCQNHPLAFHAMWINGTAPVLKGFEIGAGSGMATDHLTTSYDQALTSLLEQTYA